MTIHDEQVYREQKEFQERMAKALERLADATEKSLALMERLIAIMPAKD